MKRYLYEDKVGSIQLVQHMGNDITIVNSARVSFGVHKTELSKEDKNLINYLVKHKHTSTFEHNLATFRIKVPLYIRSQHHRHRTWSYNEVSRRYTSINLEFYEPNAFRTQHVSNRQSSNPELINPLVNQSITARDIIKSHHKYSVDLFNRLLDKGVCREQARGILPQNLYTEYYATANLNNILKFINLRIHKGAQWEIIRLAEEMLNIITNLWPVVMQAYKLNKSV
jgi:thymidylate synthase (FAD)